MDEFIPPVLTLAEAADYLRLSVDDLLLEIKFGRLRVGYFSGNKIRIKKDYLDRLLDQPASLPVADTVISEPILQDFQDPEGPAARPMAIDRRPEEPPPTTALQRRNSRAIKNLATLLDAGHLHPIYIALHRLKLVQLNVYGHIFLYDQAKGRGFIIFCRNQEILVSSFEHENIYTGASEIRPGSLVRFDLFYLSPFWISENCWVTPRLDDTRYKQTVQRLLYSPSIPLSDKPVSDKRLTLVPRSVAKRIAEQWKSRDAVLDGIQHVESERAAEAEQQVASEDRDTAIEALCKQLADAKETESKHIIETMKATRKQLAKAMADARKRLATTTPMTASKQLSKVASDALKQIGDATALVELGALTEAMKKTRARLGEAEEAERRRLANLIEATHAGLSQRLEDASGYLVSVMESAFVQLTSVTDVSHDQLSGVGDMEHKRLTQAMDEVVNRLAEIERMERKQLAELEEVERQHLPKAEATALAQLMVAIEAGREQIEAAEKTWLAKAANTNQSAPLTPISRPLNNTNDKVVPLSHATNGRETEDPDVSMASPTIKSETQVRDDILEGRMRSEPAVPKPLAPVADNRLSNTSILPSKPQAHPMVDTKATSQETPNKQLHPVILPVVAPPFSLDDTEILDLQSQEARSLWEKVKNKYQNAERIKELDRKYGRTQDITADLVKLISLRPSFKSAHRLLAHLKWLEGDREAALREARITAFPDKKPVDLQYTAAIALSIDGHDSDKKAFYALGEIFAAAPIEDYPQQWQAFVQLMNIHQDYSRLTTIQERISGQSRSSELEAFYQSLLFLLHSAQRADEPLPPIQAVGKNELPSLISKAIAILVRHVPLTQPSRIHTDSTRRHLSEPEPRLQSINEAIRPVVEHDKDSLGDATHTVHPSLPVPFHQTVSNEQSSINDTGSEPPRIASSGLSDLGSVAHCIGYIQSFKKSFGFITFGSGTFFFHISKVRDEELVEILKASSYSQATHVFFAPETSSDTRNKEEHQRATDIWLHRDVHAMLAVAKSHAEDGDFERASGLMKVALEQGADAPDASDLYRTWYEYSLIGGVPRGRNLYAVAKRIQLLERDLSKAAMAFRKAIAAQDSVESAIKDLAAILAQQGQTDQAIKVLEDWLANGSTSDRRPFENMLVQFYYKAAQYNKLVPIYRRKLLQARSPNDKASSLTSIATIAYLQEDYAAAEATFRKALQLVPGQWETIRRLVVCLIKSHRLIDAERELDRIADPDIKVYLDFQRLVETISSLKAGDQTVDDINLEIMIETRHSASSIKITSMAQFFLDRCQLEGLSHERVESNIFDLQDARYLEGLAKRHNSWNTNERSLYYMSAAKVYLHLQDAENLGQFYRCLCHSLVAKGDITIAHKQSLDLARELYCEALIAADGISRSPGEIYDQDASNALVRYILATLGPSHVPLTPDLPPLSEALATAINRHPNPAIVFDAIANALRSRYAYAALKPLYTDIQLRDLALNYLSKRGIYSDQAEVTLQIFVQMWGTRYQQEQENADRISDNLRLLRPLDFSSGSLEMAVQRVMEVSRQPFYDLDQQNLKALTQILHDRIELNGQSRFEDQEQYCTRIAHRCSTLLSTINEAPTQISTGHIYDVLLEISADIEKHYQSVLLRSTPEIDIELAVTTYIPDNHKEIFVQITLTNKAGCAPAEKVHLVVQPTTEVFRVIPESIIVDGSLRGGEPRIMRVPLRVTHKAIDAQSFVLPILARYRTREQSLVETGLRYCNIRLGSQDEFDELENPYADYADGGPVEDPQMFYGRWDYIRRATKMIQNEHKHSFSYVIYGQKRSGKSSIMHHLRIELDKSPNIMIVDLKNIGAIMDEGSHYSFLYAFLYSILLHLKDEILARIEKGFPKFSFVIPEANDFFNHPAPMVVFQRLFSDFKRASRTSTGWKDLKIVLFIDEFNYIYWQIMRGQIPLSFMKNWKAMLQDNNFSAVLVGQDVMKKFKNTFPNEFGTTHFERVTYLDEPDARALVDEPIRQGGRHGETRYLGLSIGRILELSASNPYYIQIICNKLVQSMNQRKARLITEADVEQATYELIHGLNRMQIGEFENLINGGDESESAISNDDALSVLRVIALNSRDDLCHRNDVRCDTLTPIDTILQDLIERDVIVNYRTDFYRIRVGLFQRWLADE